MWIKTGSGEVVNTEYIVSYDLVKGRDGQDMVRGVISISPSFIETCLFSGAGEECKAYMDKLMIALNGGGV